MRAGLDRIWQPYLIGAGWSPYANGMWALYPGAGYSWVSPYPWGWLPYHSGAWSFFPGYGWGWQPGGSWMGLNNIAATGFAPTGSSIASSTAAMGVLHAPTRPVGPALVAGQPRAFVGAGKPYADGDVGTERAGKLCVREELGWAGSAAWLAGRFERSVEQRGEAWVGEHAGVCRGAGRDDGTWGEPGAGDAQTGSASGAIGKFFVWVGDAAGDVSA